MALSAAAQTEVARNMGTLDFIPKNLTADGKVTPYCYSSEDFTIFDKDFNVVKTISVPQTEISLMEWKENGKVAYSEREVTDKNDKEWIDVKWDVWVTNPETGIPEQTEKEINTFDDWKQYVSERFGAGQVAFVDEDGNFAFGKDIEYCNFSNIHNVYSVSLTQRYYFYNKESKRLIMRTIEEKASFNIEGVAWTKVEGTEKVGNTVNSWMDYIHYTDYDLDGAENHLLLTQSLLDKDSKFEYVLENKKKNGVRVYSISLDSADVDGAYLNRTMREDYDIYYDIMNEDGKVLLSLPDNMSSSKDCLAIFKLDGKLYIESFVRTDEGYQTVIYLYDAKATSLTEVVRTAPVAVPAYFNTQGMKTGKDARGIVIQSDGRKVLNR